MGEAEKGNGKKISIVGAKENNLKDVSVDIPLRKDGMCNRSIRLTENHLL